MRFLTDAAYLSAALATAPVWAWRMHRAGKLRTDWPARFGRGTALGPAKGPRLLVHAVSVGEVNAVRTLVERVAGDPSMPEVVISATTDTGFARATQLYGSRHAVVRYPFDASWMVERFLDRVRPEAVALCELEVWPNFVDACARRGIPVLVVNGRLSARSFARYRKVRAIVAPTFRKLHSVLAQDQDYAGRFFGLGVPAGRIFVSGTMKWDSAQIADRVEGAEALASAMGIDRSRPLVVAGSTAPEEHQLLRSAVPAGAQLLCAPRKPEWFDAAADELPGCVRRSQPGRGNPGSGLFLLDTIGELRAAYGLADVVVVGRSFGMLHGSDPMEPAALGRAVVAGPRMGDFAESVRVLLGANAMVQTDADRLGHVIRSLLGNPEERTRLGRAAQDTVRAHQGATERTAEALLSVLIPREAAHA